MEALNDVVHTEDSKVMMTIASALGLHAAQCESDTKLQAPVATAQHALFLLNLLMGVEVEELQLLGLSPSKPGDSGTQRVSGDAENERITSEGQDKGNIAAPGVGSSLSAFKSFEIFRLDLMTVYRYREIYFEGIGSQYCGG